MFSKIFVLLLITLFLTPLYSQKNVIVINKESAIYNWIILTKIELKKDETEIEVEFSPLQDFEINFDEPNGNYPCYIDNINGKNHNSIGYNNPNRIVDMKGMKFGKTILKANSKYKCILILPTIDESVIKFDLIDCCFDFNYRKVSFFNIKLK